MRHRDEPKRKLRRNFPTGKNRIHGHKTRLYDYTAARIENEQSGSGGLGLNPSIVCMKVIPARRSIRVLLHKSVAGLESGA